MAWEKYQGKGGRYRYYLKKDGKKYSHVVKTHEEGKKWEVETKQKIDAAKRLSLVENTMYSEATQSYLELCETWQGKNTVNEKYRCYKDLASFIGHDFDVCSIDLSVINKFKLYAFKAFGPKAANRRLQKLGALWTHLHKEGKVVVNPWRQCEQFPEDETPRNVPTPQEVSAMLLAANGWEKDFLLMLLHSAARPGEIRNMTWDDVNFERNAIVLWTKKRKGGKRESRPMPMTDETRHILQRLWKERRSGQASVFCNPKTGGAWDRNHKPMKTLMERVCKRAGVEEYTLYALRHYVAQRFADSGKATHVDAQRLLGHQRPSTTDHYLRSLSPDLDKMARILESEVKVSMDGIHEKSPSRDFNVTG